MLFYEHIKDMLRIIMHGCNGKMGQVISGLVKDDPEVEIVAGIDVVDNKQNDYETHYRSSSYHTR